MTKKNGNGRRNGPARHGRNGGGRPKISWPDAFAYFAALGPDRSLREVADKFPVSYEAVKRHARDEGWQAKVVAMDAQAAAGAERRVVRSLEERKVRTLQLVEKARDFALALDFATLDPATLYRSLPRYLRHELLIEGEATDRISLAEMDALQHAYHDFILELVAASERGERVSAEQIPERLRAHLEDSLAATNGEVAP